MTRAEAKQGRDWASSVAGFAVPWGLPIAALIAAAWLDPPLKTLVWLGALGWMGVACLLNARNCGRRHCFITGPFFLVMTVPVALHGFDLVSLGPQGWRWLGLAIGIGGGVLWYFPEMIWGKYVRRSQTGA